MTGSTPANNENKAVIPAQAGIQYNIEEIDSCFRRNDKIWHFLFSTSFQFFNNQIIKRCLDIGNWRLVII